MGASSWSEPQLGRDQGAISLHALAQIDQRAGQVGQGPVEVGAVRLLHHFFERVEAEMGDPEPDQVRDLGGVLAQVAASANIVLAVRIASSKWLPATSARNRTWSAAARSWSGPSSPGSVSRSRRSGLARGSASRAHPAGPPSPPARARRRRSCELVERQLGERHRLVAGTLGRGLLAVEEKPLLHEALQVILGGIAGVQLPQFRQELILEGGHRRRHRLHVR